MNKLFFYVVKDTYSADGSKSSEIYQDKFLDKMGLTMKWLLADLASQGKNDVNLAFNAASLLCYVMKNKATNTEEHYEIRWAKSVEEARQKISI